MRRFKWVITVGLMVMGGSLCVWGAPKPKESDDKVTAADLKAVLGKPPASPEMRKLALALKEKPTVSYSYWTTKILSDIVDSSFYLIWKKQGLEILVREEKIRAVWVYNEGADGYSKYIGELPEGLSFEDGPEEVAKKLGEPVEEPSVVERDDLIKGKIVVRGWYSYKNSILIEFRGLKEKVRIHSIGLHLQE